jgi:AcrR family transcriptional regulator
MDGGGSPGLTMRRLAAELGVDPMAVYHYYGSKRSIILALVDAVFEAFPAPDAAAPWQQQVRAWARAYRVLARAHPLLVLAVISDPEAVGLAALHASESLVDTLTSSAGLEPGDVAGAVALLADYVNGYALPLAWTGEGVATDPISTALAGQPQERFPAQRRLIAALDGAAPDAFELGLDVIVAGLEARSRRA